jgi:hypothetical protein
VVDPQAKGEDSGRDQREDDDRIAEVATISLTKPVAGRKMM